MIHYYSEVHSTGQPGKGGICDYQNENWWLLDNGGSPWMAISKKDFPPDIGYSKSDLQPVNSGTILTITQE